MTKIYVGNLSFRVTDEDVRKAFALHGEVSSASIVMDRQTGRSRGFGFVEMPHGEEAQAAIVAINGKEIGGRVVSVNVARPPNESPAKTRSRPAQRSGESGFDSDGKRK